MMGVGLFVSKTWGLPQNCSFPWVEWCSTWYFRVPCVWPTNLAVIGLGYMAVKCGCRQYCQSERDRTIITKGSIRKPLFWRMPQLLYRPTCRSLSALRGVWGWHMPFVTIPWLMGPKELQYLCMFVRFMSLIYKSKNGPVPIASCSPILAEGFPMISSWWVVISILPDNPPMAHKRYPPVMFVGWVSPNSLVRYV